MRMLTFPPYIYRQDSSVVHPPILNSQAEDQPRTDENTEHEPSTENYAPSQQIYIYTTCLLTEKENPKTTTETLPHIPARCK